MQRSRVGRRGGEGVTVTFRHRDTDAPLTLVEPGESSKVALRALCERVNPHYWRIGTISTVMTVYHDLTAARPLRAIPEFGGGDRTHLTGRDQSSYIGGVQHPEIGLVAQAGVKEWL